MKRAIAILILCLSVGTLSRGDERTTLFEGLGLRLVSITDSMTDKKQCALFVNFEFGPLYLSIEGADKATIWPKDSDVFFAPDSDHLIRLGNSSPFKLQVLTNRNGLAIANGSEVRAMIKTLAKGDTLRVRYVEWPSHNPVDIEDLSSFAFPYVWSIASEKCGWPALDGPKDLPPAKLYTHESEDKDNKGYASLSVLGNMDLGMMKTADTYGGGCQVTIKSQENVGFKKKVWTSEVVDRSGNQKLIVRDKSGTIVFEGKVPTEYGRSSPTPWPLGESAARAMWQQAPLGSVEIEGSLYQPRTILYGFRELWAWGQQNCQLPAVDH
jgi:hypothetical protein